MPIRPLNQSKGAVFRVFISVFFAILILGLVFSVSNPALAAKKKKEEPNTKYASIVIDADTGMVLSQENADHSLHPASLTKIMTMVLLFDALENGQLTQKSRLVATSHAASMPPSKVGLAPGKSISVYDALRTLSTKSANDVAVTVAENLGGSETKFARLMNLKARGIGMTGTNFVNASGLHDYRQLSTARDMAKLAKYLIDTYPKYYSIFGISQYTYAGKSYHNHNKLMKTYSGMDGIKTGYVAASGFNLVASAKRGNTRLIGVVFGGRTAASRNSHMADLLDRGFIKISQIRTAGYYGDGRMSRITSNEGLPPPLPAAKPLQFKTPTEQAITPETRFVDSSTPSMKTVQISPTISGTLTASDMAVSEIASSNLTPNLAVTTTATAIAPVPLPAATSQLPDAKSLGSLTLPVEKPAKYQTMETQTRQTSPSHSPRYVLTSPTQPAAIVPTQQTSTLLTSTATIPDWQIQIGAFEDRTSTNKALYDAMSLLPKNLSKGKTLVIPLRTPDAKWVFRARLAGYTQSEAIEACKHLKTRLKDCLPIAPQTR
ncbi:MAG: D-alanyl-D-alanine carboxypeptidase family protein [Pseudobdellovibrionaceae bacterium]|jgi:D-alanyl-D-alanine carboxypeptidase|nr:D-alanyl-D-alanine carboxypeptidase family protein [Pseudobdellovibrionaceae bacterium]